jgi:hypothetical protein
LVAEGAAGFGFTVMVNIWGIPSQEPMDGITVMVATTGFTPVLVAVKELILPFPLAPKPMEVLLLVQANKAPAGLLEKVKGPAICPWQNA